MRRSAWYRPYICLFDYRFFLSFLVSEVEAFAELKSMLRHGERPKLECSAIAISESSDRVLTLTRLSPSLSFIADKIGLV